MIVGYLTSLYGRASDTFIRGEVRQLRRLGHTVHTYSIRRPDPSQVLQGEVAEEHARTEYLLDGPGRVLQMFLSAALVALRSPLRFLEAARLVWRIGPPGLAFRVRQAAYLLEASLLSRLLRRDGVRHLHDHIGENSGTVAMLASLFNGTPFSMTIHGPGTFYEAERWGIGIKVARSAFTVCISDFCRSQVMVFTPFAHWDKLRIVRCGVDERFLAAEAVAPPPDRPRLVSVGRLCADKGQPLLLEAAARLAREGLRFELVLVGDGPLRGEVEGLVDRLGLRGTVRLTGWVDTQRVREELVGSRAFVLPSFAEGLPVVIMEALALGRPVISTSIAGIPELVIQGRTGWLVPAGSVDRLAEAMREALQAPVERLAAMGREGRELVVRRHDAAREATRLAALFTGAAPRDAEAALPGPSARPGDLARGPDPL
jgi:glycosyltransferase involved in cell wall biosynthesis